MKSPKNPQEQKHERTPAKPRREGDVRHILDKALPPGIEVEDVQDPGKTFDGTPADDRS